jgi:hypothetical protein
MRKKTVCSCSQLLAQARLPVLERARKLSRLERIVLQCLPPELGRHCKVLNVKNETLIVATPSSARAARLRFAVPDLLQHIKQQLALNIHAVDVRIQPESEEKQPIKRPSLQISLSSATLLAQTARTIDYPPLQEALYRLAAKTREI